MKHKINIAVPFSRQKEILSNSNINLSCKFLRCSYNIDNCFKFVPWFHIIFHGSPALLADCCSIMSVLSGSDHLSNVHASYTIPSFFIMTVKAVDFNLTSNENRAFTNYT